MLYKAFFQTENSICLYFLFSPQLLQPSCSSSSHSLRPTAKLHFFFSFSHSFSLSSQDRKEEGVKTKSLPRLASNSLPFSRLAIEIRGRGILQRGLVVWELRRRWQQWFLEEGLLAEHAACCLVVCEFGKFEEEGVVDCGFGLFFGLWVFLVSVVRVRVVYGGR